MMQLRGSSDRQHEEFRDFRFRQTTSAIEYTRKGGFQCVQGISSMMDCCAVKRLKDAMPLEERFNSKQKLMHD
uniref:Uncharacterized protein n=1 Tax=Salix viminalis TaxID=40686 RepID=A0A6N2NAI0_SALVM